MSITITNEIGIRFILYCYRSIFRDTRTTTTPPPPLTFSFLFISRWIDCCLSFSLFLVVFCLVSQIMNTSASMFSVHKNALIANVDSSQLDYVEMDPKARYVRVHSLYSSSSSSYTYTISFIIHPFAYISFRIQYVCLIASAHCFIHMIKLLLFMNAFNTSNQIPISHFYV